MVPGFKKKKYFFMFIYMPLVHLQLILFEVHLNLRITNAFNLKSVQRSGSKPFQQVMMYIVVEHTVYCIVFCNALT